MLSIVEESDVIYTVHPPLATAISIAIGHTCFLITNRVDHFYYNMTKEHRENR